MMEKIRYIILIAAAVIACSCSQTGKQEKALGPEETVEAFCKAMACGDFTVARELCDTVSMASYIGACQERWDNMARMDSALVDIAAALLSTAQIEIKETVRDGECRKVFYTIDATMGMKKEKVATVKKEEGAWRVGTISDAQ